MPPSFYICKHGTKCCRSSHIPQLYDLPNTQLLWVTRFLWPLTFLISYDSARNLQWGGSIIARIKWRCTSDLLVKIVAFEDRLIVGSRSHGANISKRVAFFKYSRAAVVKLFKRWTISRETGSERASCGHQGLVNAREERRVAWLVQNEIRAKVHQISADLNQGYSQTISECNVRRTASYLI